MTEIIFREQNGITLIELAPRLAVQVDTRETEVIPSEQKIDPFQPYQDGGGVFGRDTFYRVMFVLEDFVSGNVHAKARELFSNALMNQPSSYAKREGVVLTDEQKWLYCLLRDNQVSIPQGSSENGRNSPYWSDQKIFAEVLKFPSLADWKTGVLTSLHHAT